MTDYTFSIDKVIIKYDILLDLPNTNLFEFFNLITLQQNTPFVYFNNLYKIYKGFSLFSSWLYISDNISNICENYDIEDTNNTIIIKHIPNYNLSDIYSDKDYSNIIITKKDDKFYLIFTYNDKIDKNIYIKNISSLFDNKIQILSETLSGVSGEILLPNIKFNKQILLDYIMNISSYNIFIDESSKTTKQRSAIHFNFILSSNDNLYTITATLLQRLELKDDVPYYYVRIKIKYAETLDIAKLFANEINLFFKNYNKDEKKLTAIYSKYIDNFTELYQDNIKITKTKIEKKILEGRRSCNIPASLINISDYKILDDNIIEDKSNKEYKYIKTNNDDYYICDTDKKNNIPYFTKKNFPCCKATEKERKGSSTIGIIQTQKKLTVTEKLGNIDKNLFNILNIINNNDWYRLGIYSSPSSFLSCVIYTSIKDKSIQEKLRKISLNISSTKLLKKIERFINNDNITVKYLEDITKIVRSTLSSFFYLCKQEQYNINDIDIKNSLDDKNVYLDPYKYIHILEELFEYNIYIFKNIYPCIMQPYYTNIYYKFIKYPKCICIYENEGTESDDKLYPHCELLSYNTKNRIDINSLIFLIDNQNVFDIYNTIYLQTKLNNTIISLDTLPSYLNIISQYIDSYGKTRRLNILYQNSIISINISPIQPLNYILDNKIYLSPSYSLINKFLLENNIEYTTNINKFTNKLYNIIFNINSISCEIIFDEHITDFKDTTLSTTTDFIIYNNNSYLSQYKYNKQIAEYLIEYSYWLFSIYLNKKNINSFSDITQKLFKKFYTKYTIIKTDYKYELNNNAYFSYSSTFIDNKKLIITSNLLLTRLLYNLNVYTTRHFDNLLKYKDKTIIDFYYKDIDNFTKHDNEYIFNNINSLYLYNQNDNNNRFYIYNDIIQLCNIDSLYLYQNLYLDDNIYLAQNTYNMESAKNIIDNWIINKYNPSIYNNQVVNDINQYIIIHYYSINNLSIYKYKDDKIYKLENYRKYDPKILIYKIQGVELFTVLLNF